MEELPIMMNGLSAPWEYAGSPYPELGGNPGLSCMIVLQVMNARIRRIAVFIDGGFFLKRLPRMNIPDSWRDSPASIATTAYNLCKQHVLRLVGREYEQDGRWLDHAYRFFYYDAWPYDKQAHHPLLNQQIDFNRTAEARFRRELFEHLRQKRKFAVRLGHVDRAGGWQLGQERALTQLLHLRRHVDILRRLAAGDKVDGSALDEEARTRLHKVSDVLDNLQERDVVLQLRQKGVDMRLGIDIASIVLKQQADTLVLVTGDSDFVPVAKLARREGAEVILDPMWQSIRPSLHEHIDGLCSVLGRQQDEEVAKNSGAC